MERRRRKSITIFEVKYDELDGNLLDQIRQPSDDEDELEEEENEQKLLQMKDTIERLSNQPSEVLVPILYIKSEKLRN